MTGIIRFAHDPYGETLQLQITPDSFHSLGFLFSAILAQGNLARSAENKNPALSRE